MTMIANATETTGSQAQESIPCTAVLMDGEGSAAELAAAVSEQPEGASPNQEVIVLDISPVEENGEDLIRQIQQSAQMPIIVLSTGRRDETLKLSGTENDSESHARFRVVRCRMVGASASNNPSVFQVGELRVDLVRRFVTVRGEPVRLSKNEFRLLAAFVRNAGRTLTGRQLLEEAFGADTTKTEHYLRMYIMLLRRRVERNAGKPRYILTDRNRGYRLIAPQNLSFSAMKQPA